MTDAPVKPSALKARDGAQQDTTSLDPILGKGTHRDYIAHAFRWGWANRLTRNFLDLDNNRLLDAGCGPHAPLATELSISPPIIDIETKTYVEYVGVDLNNVKPRVNPKWATFYGKFDLIARYQELVDTHGQFAMATSFEVADARAPGGVHRGDPSVPRDPRPPRLVDARLGRVWEDGEEPHR